MENSAQSDSLPQTLTNADGPEDSTPNIMNNNLEPLATQNYQRQMWNADTSNAELNSETASKIWKSLLIGQNPDTLQMDKVPRRGDAEMKILAKRAREKARYERNKSDPAKAMLMKSRYHANYLKRKENYIPFSQRTEVEKRILRKVWRENKRASRLNKASANLKMTLTHEELDGAEKSFKSDASICLSSDQGSLGSTRGNSPHESSLTQQPNTNDASFLNMDVARLIQKVKEREPLWDRKHVYYHDRTMTMSLWEEVAYSLNVDSETARAKWKGLRDTFRGELRKLHKTMVAGKPRTSTNWEYFDKMLFVKDQIYSYQRHHEEIKKRRKLLETQSQSCTTDDSNECDLEFQHRRNLDSIASSSGSPPEEIVIHPTVKVEPFDPIDDYVEPEVDESLSFEEPTSTAAERVNPKSKKDSIEKTIDDDDFNFLMSLLPQMKCLPMTRNLFVRLKIQELLYNEIVAAGQTVQSTS
ncbi:Hypothetical protein NTJ_06097 [Nesidiocoris tenuis]|uniref:MADF domain-containing protein n=1 Tax=Nesidiocoris tenuis TaxID=355587 RepID=A0ABN7AMK9_9HEMI|nr:Hypothetical protein NTJ_06097 [Nesidiocoris tenuis]